MSKTIFIPAAILSMVPGPKTAGAIAATERALASGMPPPAKPLGSHPYTSILVPDDLYTQINSGRGAAARYISAAILVGAGGRAPEPKPLAPPEPKKRKPMLAVAATVDQRRVIQARADRVRTAIEDAEDNKWARITMTAGHRSVDQYREDGDYYDEMESGLVFRTIVPMGLSSDAAAAWVRRKMGDAHPFARVHWWYLDGDSETLTNARDAAMRAEVAAAGGEAAEQIASIERAEALQLRIFGRRTAFLALAEADVKALGVDAHPALLQIAASAPKKPLADSDFGK